MLEGGMEPLFIDMQGAHWVAENLYQPVPDARRFENWEFAYALVLGMGAAAKYAIDLKVEEIEPRVKQLAEYTRSRLESVSGVTVLDRGAERCGIVTADVKGHSPTDVVAALRERGINTSASLWEYAVLDFGDKAVEGAVRISPHCYNTEAEIDAAVEVIGKLGT
jgi:selenocysteine lyase/cysteine desulfurase